MSAAEHKVTLTADDRGSIPLYFGCWSSVGHFFHRTDGSSADYGPMPIPKPKAGERFRLAGPPTPWGHGVERLPPNSNRQGAALLHHLDGWTALAVDDYTIDNRPNSKSVFCFPAVLNLDEALAAAAEHFPKIVKRIGPIAALAAPTVEEKP